jgi:NitT/TauT family transport system substrate-binding protein
MQRRNAKSCAFFLVLMTLLAATAIEAQQKKLEPLSISYHNINATYTPLWIAKEKNLYEKYGLDVRLTYIAATPVALSALVAGDVQLTSASNQAGISAAARGAPVVIAATFGPQYFQLIGHPSITSVEALKGKTIGNSRIGGNIDFALQRLLRNLRLLPGKDVQLVATGVVDGRQRAMLVVQGRVDATLGTPFNVAELALKGYHLNALADYTGSGAVMLVTRRFLVENRPKVRAFLMAFSEAISIGKKQREVAFEVIRKYLRIDDPQLLELNHRHYLLDQIPAKPYPVEEVIVHDIEDLSSQQPELKAKRPAEFLDVSVLEELEREGFFSRLYR